MAELDPSILGGFRYGETIGDTMGKAYSLANMLQKQKDDAERMQMERVNQARQAQQFDEPYKLTKAYEASHDDNDPDLFDSEKFLRVAADLNLPAPAIFRTYNEIKEHNDSIAKEREAMAGRAIGEQAMRDLNARQIGSQNLQSASDPLMKRLAMEQPESTDFGNQPLVEQMRQSGFPEASVGSPQVKAMLDYGLSAQKAERADNLPSWRQFMDESYKIDAMPEGTPEEKAAKIKAQQLLLTAKLGTGYYSTTPSGIAGLNKCDKAASPKQAWVVRKLKRCWIMLWKLTRAIDRLLVRYTL